MASLVEVFGGIQVSAQYVPDGQGVAIDPLAKAFGVIQYRTRLVGTIHDRGVFHVTQKGEDPAGPLGGLNAGSRLLRTFSYMRKERAEQKETKQKNERRRPWFSRSNPSLSIFRFFLDFFLNFMLSPA